MINRPSLRAEELDVTGSLFGLRYIPGGSPDGLIELYIEDDEHWHYKATFNHFWLNDLEMVILQAKKDHNL